MIIPGIHSIINIGRKPVKPEMPTISLPEHEAALGGKANAPQGSASLIRDCEDKTGKENGRRIFFA